MFNKIQSIWRQQQIVENVVSKAEQFVGSFKYLLIGIILGLLGGLWGNILDRYLYKYGLTYILLLAVVSCILLIVLFVWIIKIINPLIKESENGQKKVKDMITELEHDLNGLEEQKEKIKKMMASGKD